MTLNANQTPQQNNDEKSSIRETNISPKSNEEDMSSCSVKILGYPDDAELIKVRQFFQKLGKLRNGFPKRFCDHVSVVFQSEQVCARVVKSVASSLIIGGHGVEMVHSKENGRKNLKLV